MGTTADTAAIARAQGRATRSSGRRLPSVGALVLALLGGAALCLVPLAIADDVARHVHGFHGAHARIRPLAHLHAAPLGLALLVTLAALLLGQLAWNVVLAGEDRPFGSLLAGTLGVSLLALPSGVALLELGWQAFVAAPAGAPAPWHLLGAGGADLAVLAPVELTAGVLVGAAFERFYAGVPRSAYLAWALLTGIGSLLAAGFARVQLDGEARYGVGTVAALSIVVTVHLINRPPPEGTAPHELDHEHRLRLRWIPWLTSALVALVVAIESARLAWA